MASWAKWLLIAVLGVAVGVVGSGVFRPGGGTGAGPAAQLSLPATADRTPRPRTLAADGS